jgi:hypothetical protein
MDNLLAYICRSGIATFIHIFLLVGCRLRQLAYISEYSEGGGHTVKLNANNSKLAAVM